MPSATKTQTRRATANLVASHLHNLFPDCSASPPYASAPKLPDWLSYVLARTQLPRPVLWHACLLLTRYAAMLPSYLPPSPSSPHLRGSGFLQREGELEFLRRCALLPPLESGGRGDGLDLHAAFAAAYMLASDLCVDRSYTRASWSVASRGLFRPRDLERMGVRIAEVLDWELRDGVEDEEEWAAWCDGWELELEGWERRTVEEDRLGALRRKLSRPASSVAPQEPPPLAKRPEAAPRRRSYDPTSTMTTAGSARLPVVPVRPDALLRRLTETTVCTGQAQGRRVGLGA